MNSHRLIRMGATGMLDRVRIDSELVDLSHLSSVPKFEAKHLRKTLQHSAEQLK